MPFYAARRRVFGAVAASHRPRADQKSVPRKGEAAEFQFHPGQRRANTPVLAFSQSAALFCLNKLEDSMKLESIALHHGYTAEPTTHAAAVPIRQAA